MNTEYDNSSESRDDVIPPVNIRDKEPNINSVDHGFIKIKVESLLEMGSFMPYVHLLHPPSSHLTDPSMVATLSELTEPLPNSSTSLSLVETSATFFPGASSTVCDLKP